MCNLSLYIHIPFCVRKCNYCDFLSAPCDETTKQKYVDTLCREMEQRAKDFEIRSVDTIFFGGGTPSILTCEQITKIIVTIRENFKILADAEITMEVNPGTVDKEKLETYKRLGINRLSIGLQSANNEELKVLGRIHTWEEFLHTWELVQEVGYSNVNIDLMSALPGQTVDSYRETVEKVLALKPEHISAYSLIIEEGTPFYVWFGEEAKLNNCVDSSRGRFPEFVKYKKLPDEDADRQMYELTKRLLEEKGYYRYEISNYALKGYECKHNIGYWKRKEYLGLGLGAASLLCGYNENGELYQYRCSNVMDLQKYLEESKGEEDIHVDVDYVKEEVTEERGNSWVEESTSLSIKDQMEEFMFLGLRMMEGVSPEIFEEQFAVSLDKVYGEQISKLIEQGLLKKDEERQRIALTDEGIDVSNMVFVEFIEG